MKLLLVSILLGLGLPTLSHADETNSSGCTAPATAEPTTVVDVPQYSAPEDDDAPDPAAEARALAWSDYQQKVVASLKTSSDPRAWAVAASFNSGAPSSAERAENIALLRRAVAAASDDALVQWIALTGAQQLDAPDLAAAAVNRLTQIESDNGEVWMEVLQRAALRHDRNGVSAALRRMSSASHMDNHFADVAKVLVDAFERNPMPEELSSVAVTGSSGKANAYTYAMGIAAAFALPAYQHLVVACQWDESGRNADRAPDCELAGRAMSQHGDTLLGRSIGFVVLRVSHTFNDDDIEAARQTDWVTQNFSDLAMKRYESVVLDAEDNDMATAYLSDWIETGSEIDAMRRRIVHDGLSPTPPDDWVSKAPRFAPERIKEGDNLGAEKLAKAAY